MRPITLAIASLLLVVAFAVPQPIASADACAGGESCTFSCGADNNVSNEVSADDPWTGVNGEAKCGGTSASACQGSGECHSTGYTKDGGSGKCTGSAGF